MTISNDFIIELKKKGFTRDRIARLLGVSVFLVQKWDNGQRKISPSVSQLITVLKLVQLMAPPVYESVLKESI